MAAPAPNTSAEVEALVRAAQMQGPHGWLLRREAPPMPRGVEELGVWYDEVAAEKAVAFFHGISIEGGYVYYVTPDRTQRWGERRVGERTIEVQPPGTPAVGTAFLRVYEVTNSRPALEAALDAAKALIRGQNDLGGWQHTIRFDRSPGKSVSFDDDQTQGAISFLMAVDQHVDDDTLSAGIVRALDMMLAAQLENGGWPHVYPEQGNYHDYATFNDEGIND